MSLESQSTKSSPLSTKTVKNGLVFPPRVFWESLGIAASATKATQKWCRTAQDYGHQGFVYFAEADGGRAIKIGHAMVPRTRLFGLITTARSMFHNPEVRYLGIIRGTRREEHAAHRAFAHLRIEGEWFHSDADLRAHIDGLGDQLIPREWWTLNEKQLRTAMDPPPPPRELPKGTFRYCRKTKDYIWIPDTLEAA